MKKPIIVLLVIVALQLSGAVHATEKAPQSDLPALEIALESLVKALPDPNKANIVQDVLNSYWNDKEEVGELAKQIVEGFSDANRIFEKKNGRRVADGSEYLGKIRLGASWIKYSYVFKFERQLFPIAFRCYNANGNWNIMGIDMGEKAWENVDKLMVAEPSK